VDHVFKKEGCLLVTMRHFVEIVLEFRVPSFSVCRLPSKMNSHGKTLAPIVAM